MRRKFEIIWNLAEETQWIRAIIPLHLVRTRIGKRKSDFIVFYFNLFNTSFECFVTVVTIIINK